MYQNKKIGVIIAAAGSGTRMGGGISKQFRSLEGMPVVARAVKAFEDHPWVDEILVVTREDSLEFCREEMIAPFGFAKVRGVMAGGAQRQDSVYRGLVALEGQADFVLVHDGARPFLSLGTISAVIETVVRTGAAVAAVPVKDTIKRVTAGADGDRVFSETLERSGLYGVQTPQAFSTALLRAAMEKAFEENFYGTDDSVLVERTGQKVYLVEGEPENIKITTAEDMEIGGAIARRMAEEGKSNG